MAINISGTTITFNDATTQTTAGKSGTVTSVATGNGLSGGTITTTGTLILACPTFNSVGSYAMVIANLGLIVQTVTSGSNYGVGTGLNQLSSVLLQGSPTETFNQNNLSGTWKWMGASVTSGGTLTAIACRVS